MKQLWWYLALFASFGLAANAQTGVELLGPHNLAGRGCGSCHITTSGGTPATIDGTVLFLHDLTPSYTSSDGVPLEQPTVSASVARSNLRMELCSSCHDGLIAPPTMTTSTTYEQQAGLAPSSTTVALTTDTTTSGGEHPVGSTATLASVGVAQFFQFRVGGCTWYDLPGDCLKISPSAFAYQAFAQNYGAPNIISNGHSSPVVLPDADPAHAYIECATCHNVHSSSTFDANVDAPIAGSPTGTYATIASVAAPYNPGASWSAVRPTSATQF